jgi:RimJ/RimL family protein N-acetyltransferase
MGTLLLQYLCRVAKQRGIKKFFAKVLPTNKAMLSVFYNSGYKVNTEFDGDVYSVEFDLAPHKP